MNKKIALPMENGVLSEHFGHCQYFSIVTVENDKITGIEKVTPPEHAPGIYPKFVAQFGTTDVIGGGMGPQAVNLFIAQNINVFVGAPISTDEVLVNDFLAGKLNLNANYCNHTKGDDHECSH